MDDYVDLKMSYLERAKYPKDASCQFEQDKVGSLPSLFGKANRWNSNRKICTAPIPERELDNNFAKSELDKPPSMDENIFTEKKARGKLNNFCEKNGVDKPPRRNEYVFTEKKAKGKFNNNFAKNVLDKRQTTLKELRNLSHCGDLQYENQSETGQRQQQYEQLQVPQHFQQQIQQYPQQQMLNYPQQHMPQYSLTQQHMPQYWQPLPSPNAYNVHPFQNQGPPHGYQPLSFQPIHNPMMMMMLPYPPTVLRDPPGMAPEQPPPGLSSTPPSSPLTFPHAPEASSFPPAPPGMTSPYVPVPMLVFQTHMPVLVRVPFIRPSISDPTPPSPGPNAYNTAQQRR